MATFGSSTATPSGGAYYFVSSGKNQYATLYTAPAQPVEVTQLAAYFDLYSGSGTCYVCMWDASGNLLASASVGTVSTGTQSPGGQHWHSATLATPVLLAASQQVYLGWWSPGDALWTTESSGTCASDAQSGGPGSFASHAAEQGNAIGAYATYSPAGVWIAPSGTVKSPIAVWCNPGSGPAKIIAIYGNKSGVVTRLW